MKLDELRRMAARDSVVDDTALDIESLKIPQLHNKYMNILMECKFDLSKIERDYRSLKRIKWEYYTGKMSEEDLERLEWEPFDLKILKQDLDLYLDSDDDLCLLRDKMVLAKEKLNYVESFIKELNNRHWKIRNAIEWKKFTNGVS